MADHLEGDDAARQVGGRHQRNPVVHLVLEQLHVAADRDALAGHADAAAWTGAVYFLSGRYYRGPLRLLHYGTRTGNSAFPARTEGIRSRTHDRGHEGMSIDDDFTRP